MDSLVATGRSLLVPPKDYGSVRPHHALVLYTVVRLFSKTSVYKALANKVLALLSKTTEVLIPVVYAGLVPDVLIRLGIRIQCYDHLARLRKESVEKEQEGKMSIVKELHSMPIAIDTDLANKQHYEVPAKFYDMCLGPKKKYSSGLWPKPDTTFEESETAMLDLYCERAGVKDGMNIVDLGCGWGSLTLHLIEKFPNCKITSISNSHSQREYIMATAKSRGYNYQNINVITVSSALLLLLFVLIIVLVSWRLWICAELFMIGYPVT